MTRLADLGTVYVTHAAAVTYARATEDSLEPARRRLTELLLDAEQTPGDPLRFRLRRRSEDLHLACLVVRTGRLAVVTSLIVHEAGHRAA